jgi:hypothetical protein
MIDTNACKMLYDGNEEEYEDFYDYGSVSGLACMTGLWAHGSTSGLACMTARGPTARRVAWLA